MEKAIPRVTGKAGLRIYLKQVLGRAPHNLSIEQAIALSGLPWFADPFGNGTRKLFDLDAVDSWIKSRRSQLEAMPEVPTRIHPPKYRPSKTGMK